MKKLIPVMLLAILLIGVLSSCGQEEQVLTNQKGEAMEYTMGTLESTGFYVYNKKKETFTPLMTGASGYQGLVAEHDPSRFIWFGSKDHDLVSLIPKVDNKTTQLVLVQNQSGNMPDSYVLEKYKNLGYTLGVNFSFEDTGDQLYINKNSPCESSMAKEELSSLSGQLLPVHKINDSENLPFNNIDTDVMMLLGLEKDKKYKVSVFDGTFLKHLVFIADTIAFKSQQLIVLDNPIKVTENDYFVVNLPNNLDKGYYYINDFGLFKYTGESTVAPKKETKTESKDADKTDETAVQSTEATEADAAETQQ